MGVGALAYAGIQKDETISSRISEKIYIAVEGSGEIAVFDTRTRQIIKRIDLSEDKNGMAVSYMPHNVQVAPDNKSVWVTANAEDKKMKMSFRVIPVAEANGGHGEGADEGSGSSDEVIVIDPFTDVIVKRIEMGQGLHLSHVALTPDSSYAIVAAQEKGIIYKIHTDTYEIEKELVVKNGGEPHGLRISPDGKVAYIAMLGGKSLGVLDLVNFELKQILLKGAAVQTGVTSDGRYALASVYDTKSLAVYDVVSTQLSYVDLPKEAKGPVQIYPTPDSRFVYVADQGFYFDQPISEFIYKVDLEEMKVVREIKGGSAPHGVVVSRDGNLVYVTNLKSDDVSVIDTRTDKEVARIQVGSSPNGISVWYAHESDGGTVVGKGNYSKLLAEETYFDFGTVSMAKGKVGHSFAVKNAGDSPVKILNISTSCMCTEATLVNGLVRKGPFGMPGHGGLSELSETLVPGQELRIEVFVDPAAHGPQGTGPAKKTVYVETDSALSPQLQFDLDINVVS